MSKPITYRQLYQLLRDLGFVDTSVADSHTAFYHELSDTRLLFGLHEAREAAAPHDLQKVRRVLDERGLLNQDTFDVFANSGKLPSRHAHPSPA